jgi:hypothetical protein
MDKGLYQWPLICFSILLRNNCIIGGHFEFHIGTKNVQFVEDLPMIIPGQFGFNCPSGFREKAFWNIFPIGSNVKLSLAVAAIECSLDGPLQTVRFLFRYEIQNGGYGKT